MQGVATIRYPGAPAQRGIRRTRVDKHGMATLIVHGHVARIAGVEAGVEAYAEELKKAMPGASVADRRLVASPPSRC